MKNQGQDLSNVEVVNQQIIQVKPIVDKTSGMVKLANKKFEEYTMCIQNKTIQFDGRRNVVTRTAHINLGADELTANETMQFLLQNPDLISNPVLLAEQAQAGKPILVDNNVLKGYIFLQEFLFLFNLERGNTIEFLMLLSNQQTYILLIADISLMANFKDLCVRHYVEQQVLLMMLYLIVCVILIQQSLIYL